MITNKRKSDDFNLLNLFTKIEIYFYPFAILVHHIDCH